MAPEDVKRLADAASECRDRVLGASRSEREATMTLVAAAAAVLDQYLPRESRPAALAFGEDLDWALVMQRAAANSPLTPTRTPVSEAPFPSEEVWDRIPAWEQRRLGTLIVEMLAHGAVVRRYRDPGVGVATPLVLQAQAEWFRFADILRQPSVSRDVVEVNLFDEDGKLRRPEGAPELCLECGNEPFSCLGCIVGPPEADDYDYDPAASRPGYEGNPY